MTRESILKAANGIVTTDRPNDYGDPENNFDMIANLWSDYLKVSLKAQDVAAMMILLKISRIASGHDKLDNWIDIAGYAACGGELAKNGRDRNE